MKSIIFLFTTMAPVASAHLIDCPTQRMARHHVKRAVHPRSSSKIDVNIYMHNIATGPTYDEAYVPDDLLQKQFDIIQSTYAPYGITMYLGGINHTINPQWSNITAYTENDGDMRTALHRGTYTDINMYIVFEVYYNDRPDDSTTHIDYTKHAIYKVNAFSHFPVSGPDWLSEVLQDGIVITYKTIFGGSSTGRTKGITAVHEIGHWFGLEHTFAFGCVGLGDAIADTPNEDLGAITGSNNLCPEGRDTCPGMKSNDPIHNFMDTTSDECRTEFTPGQVERMHSYFQLLRVPKVP